MRAQMLSVVVSSSVVMLLGCGGSGIKHKNSDGNRDRLFNLNSGEACPNYQQLKNSTDGLWWYCLLHGATVSVSKYMTSIASGIFGDDTFMRSPDLMFKLLTATAAVQLDDARSTTELDDFLAQCSDTRKGKVANTSSTMGDLLNMSDPACAQRYRKLQHDLKAWVKGDMPALVHKA